MAGTYDCIIVGAGIIGLNTALQLARRQGGRILVLEQGAAVGEGSTGASSAVCRFRYSRPEMVQLARDGIEAYRNWSDYLDLPSTRATFHADGVLWVAGEDGWADRESSRLSALGIQTAVLDDADLEGRFPSISPCRIAPDFVNGTEHACIGGSRHLLEIDGGYFDPVDALQDLLDACRARKVEIRFRTSVESIDVKGGRVLGVSLVSGERIFSPVVVNATGPWCSKLIKSTGLQFDWPLRPTRIQVVHLDRPASLRGPIPVVVDMVGGIYLRLQNRGQQLIVSSVLEEDEKEVVDDVNDFARYVDDEFVMTKIHALQHRLPGLAVHGVRGYSGLYTINARDVHPLVGETAIEGLYLANGCSGHGFKLAPALGSLIAQALTGERISYDTTAPASFLAVDRAAIDVESLSVLA